MKQSKQCEKCGYPTKNQDDWHDECWMSMYYDDGPNSEDYCSSCGKDFYEFGDLGCIYCDVRVDL